MSQRFQNYSLLEKIENTYEKIKLKKDNFIYSRKDIKKFENKIIINEFAILDIIDNT